jgi:hypothetical protein
MPLTFKDIRNELEPHFPRVFLDSEKAVFKELKTLHLPDDFIHMYADRSPKKMVEFGRFGLFRMEDLIDENIWEEPGETLYQLGYTIVGAAPDSQRYCLNMNVRNSSGQYEVLLFDPSLAGEGIDAKEARRRMKFVGESLVDFLARELAFFKKKHPLPKS